MSDKWPHQRRPDHDQALPVPDPDRPDDFEVLLFGGDGPELTLAQAERNTELLSALALAARTCGVVPTALQLPAAPPAPGGEPPASGEPSDVPPFDSAYCLRLGLRTRPGFPRGRTDFLNAVLRLASAYRLGLYLGEGRPGSYRRVLPQPPPPRTGGRSGRPGPRHRVIDLTAAEPVPPRSPLDGSLMVTVVGPLRRELADDLVAVATFLDDHRVGCHAATATVLPTEGTVVLNLVLVVLPGAPVGPAAFTEILRRGLLTDPVWPRAYRPTLLDPVATRS